MYGATAGGKRGKGKFWDTGQGIMEYELIELFQFDKRLKQMNASNALLSGL